MDSFTDIVRVATSRLKSANLYLATVQKMGGTSETVASQDDIHIGTMFYAHAEVALAKAAILLSSAEQSLDRGDYISAATCSYYSLFHFGQCLMWILPEQIPSALRTRLLPVWEGGRELPDKQLGHGDVEKFLCNGQSGLSISGLADIFRKARELREFVCYGPRISHQKNVFKVGPCDFDPEAVRSIVPQIKTFIPDALRQAIPKSYEKIIGDLVVRDAPNRVTQRDLPFYGWSSKAILESARAYLDNVKHSILGDDA